jgi:alanyl-tRNA synthetase
MSKKNTNQLRSEFLNYFKKQGHEVVESSSLVPHNDPTLLFTSAGMVQFKDCFLGVDVRPYKRATTAQRCLRAGGKHNDLENVGFTARHHTFFEMLGNFSFGDYFKKEAIHFAWEFLTKELGLSKNRLYVSVFKDDDEAADIWHKQEGVPRDRIFRFGEKDNFWSAGDTGPCGPCSEIYIDRGEKYSSGDPNETVGSEGERFMEIWNLVFMQYDRDSSGKLNPLARPSIDTGMGLERLASVIQEVDTNYDIDLFQNIILEISKLSGVAYRKNEKTDASIRVIADHLRAVNFLIADGVLPSNEGRGYVLRRIMRRAIRHGRNLGFREPFFYKLTDVLISEMGEAYPEIKDKKEFIKTNVKLEEERFLQTLEQGIRLLEEEINLVKDKSKVISGDVAFKLYDTYGFPLDLTQVIAKENGLSVDEQGFEKAMEVQRERSRENWKGSGEEAVDSIYKELHQKGIKTKFLGYDALSCMGRVQALIENGKIVEKTKEKKFQVVFDQTVFYAESGGQIADSGIVRISGMGFEAKVVDVQKPIGDLIVVEVDDAKGSLTLKAGVEQITNKLKRKLTAKNHTATHILHHALRKFLGEHVKQAGSLVTDEFLRFDFTHTKPLTDEEIKKIEDFINEKILLAESVVAQEMDKQEALAKGAIAFFGDKYGAKVRVISVGAEHSPYSIELCGGTHVKNTMEIMGFKILNESGIAAGIRRILAITGPKLVEQLREKDLLIQKLKDLTKASSENELPNKLEKLITSEKELRKLCEVQSIKLFALKIDEWIKNSIKIKIKGEEINLIKVVLDEAQSESPIKLLRDLSDQIKSKVTKSIIVLAAKDSAKNASALLVAITKDIAGKLVSAQELIKVVLPIIEGSGGGKPDLAQAGGKNFKFTEAFQAIENHLKNLQ